MASSGGEAQERWWWAVLALALGLRLALALGTDVYFDEAYYWLWSKRLAFGYFDHPPLIAYAIALFGIRPAALVLGLGTVAAVYAFASDVHQSRRAGLGAAALWATVPASALAGTFATPDSPLLLCWVLCLWALWRERWALAGLAGGAGLLSKYVAVLLALAVLAVVLSKRRLPRGLWLTAALGLLLFLPVIVWNAGHDWVGFGFQLRHGLAGRGGLASFTEYIGGQLLLGGLVLFPLALAWGLRGDAPLLLRAATLVPLAFFALASFRARGEANWAAMAYLSACVGMGGAFFQAGPRAKGEVSGRWLQLSAVLGLLFAAALTSHLLFPVLNLRRDVPLQRLQGWSVLRQLQPGGAVAVFGPNYQMASEAAYHTGLPAGVVGGTRKSQFDLWGPPEVKPGEDALWVSEGVPVPEALAAQFSSVEGPQTLVGTHRGRRLHEFQLWRLSQRAGP